MSAIWTEISDPDPAAAHWVGDPANVRPCTPAPGMSTGFVSGTRCRRTRGGGVGWETVIALVLQGPEHRATHILVFTSDHWLSQLTPTKLLTRQNTVRMALASATSSPGLRRDDENRRCVNHGEDACNS